MESHTRERQAPPHQGTLAAPPETSHPSDPPSPAPGPSQTLQNESKLLPQEQGEEKGKERGPVCVRVLEGLGWEVNPGKYAALWSVTFKMTAGLGQRSRGPGPEAPPPAVAVQPGAPGRPPA